METKEKKPNYSKAFTLVEILIVLVVIGVIAVLTIPTIAQKIDRNKGLFKKAYSVIERTVGELVNDETYYPYNVSYFGFKEPTDVKIVGTGCYTSSIDDCKTARDANFGSNPNYKLIKFCNLFTSNVNTVEDREFSGSKSNYKCTFETNDGISWTIKRDDDDKNFLITIDTNVKGPNQPQNIDKIESQMNVKNRDRYFIYVRDDGKIRLPEKDTVAKGYLKASNLNREGE